MRAHSLADVVTTHASTLEEVVQRHRGPGLALKGFPDGRQIHEQLPRLKTNGQILLIGREIFASFIGVLAVARLQARRRRLGSRQGARLPPPERGG